MFDPRDEGPFEAWTTLEPKMIPLLSYIGRYFLPWSDANARALALASVENVFTMQLEGHIYE